MKCGGAVRLGLKVLWKTMKWGFIVFCIFAGSLFFREQRVPGSWVVFFFERHAPQHLVLNVDSLSFGFRGGIRIDGIRLYDASAADPTRLLAGAESVCLDLFQRDLRVVGARYERLPDGYYAPGNQERNARVEAEFPKLGVWAVTLDRPDILAVRPKRVTATVKVAERRIEFDDIRLEWPDADNTRMAITGSSYVDLDEQRVEGRVRGLAKQSHIRPLLVALDVPVSLPYMDGFTEVPEPCDAACSWSIDLERSDLLDLGLELHPVLGKYNSVPMRRADGEIHVRNWTRGNCLNYHTKVGPVSATDVKGRQLRGTVDILGTNNYNVVRVEATSAQPVADVLKIGGFTGDYVGDEVIGDSECQLEFRFPRAMTNNYEVLNGRGHVAIKNGQIMRMKGFGGLLKAMPQVAPAVTWFSDSTQASGDYVIENGVLKTDDVYIEGTVFSIKMYGTFDTVKNALDFTVRVQFTQKDSFMGKILHPLTWPFTKLLLEFRLTGSPDDPQWKYVSVIDRVVEAVK